MFKFVFSAVVCAAMCLPAASFGQDCGCCEPAPAPCVKTRKKLKLVEVQTEVCRLKRVCVTDECGCSKKKFVRVKETVCRKKLVTEEVAVDPCRKGMLDRLRGRFAKKSCCEPAPCGCEAPAPAPCGCDAAPMAAPTMAAPATIMETAPMASG